MSSTHHLLGSAVIGKTSHPNDNLTSAAEELLSFRVVACKHKPMLIAMLPLLSCVVKTC